MITITAASMPSSSSVSGSPPLTGQSSGLWTGPEGLLVGPAHAMFHPRGDGGAASGGYPQVPRQVTVY
jgi:hypothetical protein